MKTLRTAAVVASLLTLPALATSPAKQAKQAKPAAEASADCHHPANTPDPKPAQDSGWTLTRGEPLKGAPSVKLAALLASPQAHDGKLVRVEGVVRKACEKKGCWMELAESKDSEGVRVTFKNYGFFVPLDSAGSQARVEGVVKVTELTEGVAAHYQGEGGTVPRGKDGKPREVQLVAAGVELRR